jgi:hypothetical protein
MPNDRELSGTPERLRAKCSLLCAGASGAQPATAGVRSNELLGGAQRRLFLNELGTTHDR